MKEGHHKELCAGYLSTENSGKMMNLSYHSQGAQLELTQFFNLEELTQLISFLEVAKSKIEQKLQCP